MKEYLEEKLVGVKESMGKAAKMYILAETLYHPHHASVEVPKETYVVKEE